MVEYALRDFKSLMGVAEWETMLTESLPDEFKGSLPIVEKFEAELTGADGYKRDDFTRTAFLAIQLGIF